ncbi:MAG: UDP-3-O-(3-hydroxymyristoyl)glucosamine N-acyltransferase [Chitinivibrionales bacterium]|nr:UDP-3-O-(3-hydroxymyristoyl)glucosamine N-acyltransferase [Chitinivibrionales bacterium]
MELARIARTIGATVAESDAALEIARISSPDNADESSIVFAVDTRVLPEIQRCRARAVIVKTGTELPGKILLAVADPYLAYARTAQLFEDRRPLFDGPVHASAVVHPDARLEKGVHVGPGSVVGAECRIGRDTVIGARCVVENGCRIGSGCHIDSGAIIRRGCVLGNNVIVQSGAIIGSEGFGNALDKGEWVRIPCFGNVVIEDDVGIGANVTIDRGNFGPTIVRRGARIDNLVHIAHNVEIGEHSALAAQVGISGSTVVGKQVLIGGQAGFVGHITIGDGAFVGAQAGVSKSVEPGAKVTGYPARDLMTMRRIDAALAKLPELVKTVRALTRRRKPDDSEPA